MSQNVINTLNFRQNLHQTSIYWVFTKSIKVGHRIEVSIPETIKIYFYTPAYKLKATKLEFRLNKLLSTLRPSTCPKSSHICSDRSIVHMCLRVSMFAQLPRVIHCTLRFWMCMFACVDVINVYIIAEEPEWIAPTVCSEYFAPIARPSCVPCCCVCGFCAICRLLFPCASVLIVFWCHECWGKRACQFLAILSRASLFPAVFWARDEFLLTRV